MQWITAHKRNLQKLKEAGLDNVKRYDKQLKKLAEDLVQLNAD